MKKKAAVVGPCDTEKAPEVIQSLQWLLALLRAMFTNYQESHWIFRGYDNHLLFQRLYEAVDGEIDALGEKMVGYCGDAVVNPVLDRQMQMYWTSRWTKVECPFHRGLEAEGDFQNVVSDLYDQLDEAGIMLMGMDDMLMSMSNTHDTHQYLLKRVAGQ